MLTVFGFAGCGSGSADHQDAGRDAGVDSTTDTRFVCKSNTDCSAPTPVCNMSSGVCLGCLMDTDCTTATTPVCDKTTNTCRGCKADSECATTGPGVCMFQDDGHCATDQETVYVANTNGCLSAAMTGGGSLGPPFCTLTPAITSAGDRSLIVIRGAIAGGAATSGSAPISIVGQMSAAITVSAGESGLHVTGTDVYVRSLAIGPATSAAATIGIIADGNATLRLDGVDIENMPQGGLRVTASGYDVINSIFAGNGGTAVSTGLFIGGALLDTPPSGALSRFAFNTVVNNKRDGVTCASSTQVVDASLLAGNFSGVADNTGCTLATSQALGTGDPLLTSTYRATATSPCVDFVKTPPSGAPDHDIDAVTRPQGQYFDCGASEFKAP